MAKKSKNSHKILANPIFQYYLDGMNRVENELLSLNTLEQTLSKRIFELDALVSEKNTAIKNAPEGSLRISKSNGVVQYYRRINPKDTIGKYILSKDKPLATELAQKDYDKKVLAAAQKELRLLNYTQKSYSKMQLAEKIFEKFNSLWRALIKPVRFTDEAFAKKWQSVSYKTKPFATGAPELFTARGERVRSKSEIIIADTLFRLKIPYRYECPLTLKNADGTKVTLHPDFTCLNLHTRREFYWEHFGMLDNPDYSEKAVQRLRLYERNNICTAKNLIITTETSKQPINTRQIERLAKSIFNIA